MHDQCEMTASLSGNNYSICVRSVWPAGNIQAYIYTILSHFFFYYVPMSGKK